MTRADDLSQTAHSNCVVVTHGVDPERHGAPGFHLRGRGRRDPVEF
jgi:hypothetical protein